jgi:hypothetical protein
MPRAKWNLQSHAFAHGQSDDDVEQQPEQNENVDPLWMPTEFLGKGIGVSGPAALDATGWKNCAVAGDQKIAGNPGALWRKSVKRSHWFTSVERFQSFAGMEAGTLRQLVPQLRGRGKPELAG